MTMLTFGPTVLQQNVTVRLTDDPLYEGREDFSLMLTTSDSGVFPSPSQANITIIDNDCEFGLFNMSADWVRLSLSFLLQ